MTGRPSLDARDPADPLDARLGKVLRLRADERRGLGEEVGSHLPAEPRVHREDVVAEEAHDADADVAADAGVDRQGDVSRLLAGDRRRTLLRELHRDLGARVPDAHEQHGAVGQLRGIPVLVRVHLHDRRVEIGGERRHLRLLEVRHRDDDVVGLERAVTGRHDEPIAATGEAVDPRAGAHRQVEALGVGLEVVRHRVLRHMVATARRERACPAARSSGRA